MTYQVRVHRMARLDLRIASIALSENGLLLRYTSPRITKRNE